MINSRVKFQNCGISSMNSVADSVKTQQSKHTVRPIGRLVKTMPTIQPAYAV
jgi:hypothetical protein